MPSFHDQDTPYYFLIVVGTGHQAALHPGDPGCSCHLPTPKSVLTKGCVASAYLSFLDVSVIPSTKIGSSPSSPLWAQLRPGHSDGRMSQDRAGNIKILNKFTLFSKRRKQLKSESLESALRKLVCF